MSHSHTLSPENPRQKSPGRDLALIAIFAAFIAVCALLPAFPIGPAGVPITFQTLAIYIAALVLGGRRGGLAALLYIVVGFIGLPVFAGGGGGIATLASPSAGYLLGYPLGTWAAGTLAYSFLSRGVKTKGLFLKLLLSGLVCFLIITATGIAGMAINADISWTAAVGAALLYVPGDLIKCVIAVTVAIAVHRAFPALAR